MFLLCFTILGVESVALSLPGKTTVPLLLSCTPSPDFIFRQRSLHCSGWSWSHCRCGCREPNPAPLQEQYLRGHLSNTFPRALLSALVLRVSIKISCAVKMAQWVRILADKLCDLSSIHMVEGENLFLYIVPRLLHIGHHTH